MKHHRRLAVDGCFLNRLRRPNRRTLDRPGDEPAHVPQRREARPLLDDHDVERPVVEPRVRSDPDAIAELHAVRDDDEEGTHGPPAIRCGDLVRLRRVGS